MNPETIFSPIGKFIFYLCLMVIGASIWIVAERFALIPGACIITPDAYEVLETNERMK